MRERHSIYRKILFIGFTIPIIVIITIIIVRCKILRANGNYIPGNRSERCNHCQNNTAVMILIIKLWPWIWWENIFFSYHNVNRNFCSINCTITKRFEIIFQNFIISFFLYILNLLIFLDTRLHFWIIFAGLWLLLTTFEKNF